jgi:undecaprenyl-diphosphatase
LAVSLLPHISELHSVVVLILAVVQALAEFLPISSSGHLALTAYFTGWNDGGVTLDLALHAGTLLSVLVYYRKDLWAMTRDLPSFRPSSTLPNHRLAGQLLLATIPALAIGALLSTVFASTLEAMRDPRAVAVLLIVFGLLLAFADRKKDRVRELSTLTYYDALIIGLMQCLALAPGVSRSGIVITAGLLIGLTRAGAARFAFLLAVPIISAGAAKGLLDVVRGTASIDLGTFLFAATWVDWSPSRCL